MSLSWINEDDLGNAIEILVNSVESSIEKSDERMQRNVIDPFSSILIASSMKVSSPDMLQSFQRNSAILSSISNALGLFHQRVLSSINGWCNHDAGYDLENNSRRILAEVKNKHNTMNSANREKVVDDLDTAVKQKGKGWKGYLVIIIPKKAIRYEDKLSTQRLVYEIDGASFYSMATDSITALYDLFLALLEILPRELKWKQSNEVIEYCKSTWRNNGN